MEAILSNKHYNESSVFLPENLLREARRQKKKPECKVPRICVLYPDGDLVRYLRKNEKIKSNKCWACYHSMLYSFYLGDLEIGIIPCVVGASYAVLVSEQLFVSGCSLLISVTSAGRISQPRSNKRFALITSAVRDEGTSYHYLPGDKPAILSKNLFAVLNARNENPACPYFAGTSWTTDAPFRETPSAILEMQKRNIDCVEMEAAALYALSQAKGYNILCFAHLTNSMAQTKVDFEKGEEFGSLDVLKLLSYVLRLTIEITGT